MYTWLFSWQKAASVQLSKNLPTEEADLTTRHGVQASLPEMNLLRLGRPTSHLESIVF